MTNTIKLAVLGACALAASSSAALAASELVPGITTGIALGAPLPEGVYDITIASYGSRTDGLGAGHPESFAVAVPVWLIWSTPWQIAGGRLTLDTATPVADVWDGASGVAIGDSFANTLVDAALKWNLGNGWNASLQAGVWLPSSQYLPKNVLGRDYGAFQGVAAVSYLANGWNLSASAFYGAGGGGAALTTTAGAEWFNLDLTATKKMGKFEAGVIAFGSWDLSTPTGVDKQSQFALGGLIGYDFGSFSAQAKLSSDVAETAYGGKEVRGWLTIIKPLWIAGAEAPLK